METYVGELAEANAMYSCVAGAAPATAARMGLAATRIGGASLTAAPADASGFWSKVIGLGVEEPVTAGLIEEILGFYGAAGAGRATFQIAPGLVPDDWDDIRDRYGLVPGPAMYKLVRDARPAPPVATRLDVGPADPSEAAAVLAHGFGWNEEDLAGIYGSALATDVMDGYAAREDDRIVGFGAVAYYRDTAEMYGAATEPGHRGKGAQTALLAARIEAARAHGCTTMFAETWIPGPDAHNPSYSNMLRAGFTVAYERPSWRWHA